MATLRVLVTNARRRKAIPIIRSLARAGMYVVCADSVGSAVGYFSRFCSERLVHPDLGSDRFVDFIVDWLSANHCDAIFPLDDDALEIFSLNRHVLPNPDALLLPSDETIHHVNDKGWLVPYAEGIGVATPKTIVVKSHSDLAKVNGMAYPLIVKPSHGSGGHGVRKLADARQLSQICEEAVAKRTSILVQEIIPVEGHGLGYFALYGRTGQLIAQFMHRRLRQYPIDAGPSTLREGIWDESLAKTARRLLESLRWVGLAMVEFKEDVRDGVPKLMEINPRFWGSVALPIFSGVDFPVLCARVTANLAVKRVLTYSLGKRARWLWPGDILHLVASLRRGRWPQGFLHFLEADTCDDMLSVRDPLPAIAYTLECLKKLVKRQ